MKEKTLNSGGAMRKALMFVVMALVVFVAANIVGPVEPVKAGVFDNISVMGGGGGTATLDQAEKWTFLKYFEGSFLKPFYFDNRVIARLGMGDWENFEEDLDLTAFNGTLMLTTRDMKGDNADKINPYIFASLDHLYNAKLASDTTGKDDKEWKINGGLGAMFNLGVTWYAEIKYMNAFGKDTFGVGLGMVWGLKKAAKKE